MYFLLFSYTRLNLRLLGTIKGTSNALCNRGPYPQALLRFSICKVCTQSVLDCRTTTFTNNTSIDIHGCSYLVTKDKWRTSEWISRKYNVENLTLSPVYLRQNTVLTSVTVCAIEDLCNNLKGS